MSKQRAVIHMQPMQNPDNNMDLTAVHPNFGAECTGLKIKEILTNLGTAGDGPNESETRERGNSHMEKLRNLVHEHKLLILRDQGVLSANQQISFSQWFGEIEDAGFEQHSDSPDRRLLLVSNNEEHGFRDFGTTGFHVDGSFMEMPNAYSIYHIIQCPQKGGTAFISLSDIYSQLPDEKRCKWERLWLLKTFKHIRGFTEHPGYVIHPLVYKHPITNIKTLCIHQGKTNRFLWDWGLNIARCASKEETSEILKEIDDEISKHDFRYQYNHKWRAGDLIISDNLAVAHMALPDTQLPPSEVGLRVMHRTVIKGVHRPWKSPLEAIKNAATSPDFNKKFDFDDVELEDIDVVKAHSCGNEQMLNSIKRRLASKFC